MNPEDLKFFLAVRRAGSIKGAARELKADHSRVSRRLSSLEEALGGPLFERTPEGLIETPLAIAIAPLAERMAALARELENTARAASGAARGPVTIAVSPVLAQCFLLPRLHALRARFADVHFDITADIAPASIVRREADLAIRLTPEGEQPAEPSAIATRVGSFGWALYASRDYIERRGIPPEPLRSLAGHEMISAGSDSPGDTWNDSLEEPATYVATLFPMAAVTLAVRAGIGLAVVSCLEAAGDENLLPITKVLGTRAIWVVTSASALRNARVTGVKDALVQMLRDESRLFDGESRGS